MAGLDVSALYREHRETLLVFFVRRTGDAEVALDLWAETFARAVKGGPRFRGQTAEEHAAWLYAIARRLLTDYHRRGTAERRALRRLELERPPATPEVLAELERRAELADMRHALGQVLADLSPGVRAAIEQRVVSERSYGEIAQSLGTTEQAVRARVSRGLTALADALDPAIVQEALRP